MAGETIRSDGSLDEFIAALQAQSAPEPKPTATQTVMDLRRRMTGQDTPAPKPRLIPGFAGGTSEVSAPDAFASYLASQGGGLDTGTAGFAADPNSAPLTRALVQGAAQRIANGTRQGGALGAGQVAGSVLGLGAVPVTAAVDVARPVVNGIGDFLTGMFGGGGSPPAQQALPGANANGTGPKDAISGGTVPQTIAQATTKMLGWPVTTLDTGEHDPVNQTLDDFVKMNSHLTNNQVMQLIQGMPKMQTPQQQLIAKLVNTHETIYAREMAAASKLTGDARIKAEQDAFDKRLSGYERAANSQVGVLGAVGALGGARE